MRAVSCFSFVAGFALAGAGLARADDQADLKAVVDKAIKAAGGEAKLKAFKAFTWKGKGTVEIGEKKVDITIDSGSMQGLDQAHLDMTAEINGKTENVAIVVNKDKGWFKSPRRVESIPKELFPFLKTDLRALRLTQMLVPLKHKECKLSALGETKINEQDAVGIKVERKGFADVDIYFDKKTGLPVKCQTQVKDSKEGGEVAHEFFFSAPKEMGGIKHFTKVVIHRDGKKMIEIEMSDIKTVDKLEDSAFAKPE
jgi:hypothetical protein